MPAIKPNILHSPRNINLLVTSLLQHSTLQNHSNIQKYQLLYNLPQNQPQYLYPGL